MKVKMVDLIEVATDDVIRWFGLCETQGDVDHLARQMHGQIDCVREGSAPGGSSCAAVVSVLEGGEWVPVATVYDAEAARIIGAALSEAKGEGNVRIDF